MKIIKTFILKIVLPLLFLASLGFSLWTLNDNYYQSQLTKYHKIDNKIIAKNTKKFTNYALSKGTITIENATTQANLDNNQYNIRGFSNGQAVSVNVDKNPKIINHQITLHRLTPNGTNYWSSEKEVRHNAYTLAKTNQELKASQNYANMAITHLMIYIMTAFLTAVAVVGYLANRL